MVYWQLGEEQAVKCTSVWFYPPEECQEISLGLANKIIFEVFHVSIT